MLIAVSKVCSSLVLLIELLVLVWYEDSVGSDGSLSGGCCWSSFGVQVDFACSVWCSGGDWDNFFDGHVVLVVLCY